MSASAEPKASLRAAEDAPQWLKDHLTMPVVLPVTDGQDGAALLDAASAVLGIALTCIRIDGVEAGTPFVLPDELLGEARVVRVYVSVCDVPAPAPWDSSSELAIQVRTISNHTVSVACGWDTTVKEFCEDVNEAFGFERSARIKLGCMGARKIVACCRGACTRTSNMPLRFVRGVREALLAPPDEPIVYCVHNYGPGG